MTNQTASGWTVLKACSEDSQWDSGQSSKSFSLKGYLKLQESPRKAYFRSKILIQKIKKRFFSMFLWHGILTSPHFIANAG